MVATGIAVDLNLDGGVGAQHVFGVVGIAVAKGGQARPADIGIEAIEISPPGRHGPAGRIVLRHLINPARAVGHHAGGGVAGVVVDGEIARGSGGKIHPRDQRLPAAAIDAFDPR